MQRGRSRRLISARPGIEARAGAQSDSGEVRHPPAIAFLTCSDGPLAGERRAIVKTESCLRINKSSAGRLLSYPRACNLPEVFASRHRSLARRSSGSLRRSWPGRRSRCTVWLFVSRFSHSGDRQTLGRCPGRVQIIAAGSGHEQAQYGDSDGNRQFCFIAPFYLTFSLSQSSAWVIAWRMTNGLEKRWSVS